MELKESIKIVNEALNLANSKGVFGTLQNSNLVYTAFGNILSKFEKEIKEINNELLEEVEKEKK